MSELYLDSLYKSFGDNRVLSDISMHIKEGEFISLLGPSGCGKTTLLKLIAGLEAPDSGSIFIDGIFCNNVPARKRGAVMVFQDYGLFPHMTVKQNIEFGLRARKIPRAERAIKIANMLELMQLSEKSAFCPSELSGGQKQRVALARACILEPNVLLLDEPFSNLDTSLKDAIYDFVLKLQRKLGITTIFVTHDKEESFMLSQRVAVIFDGRIQQFDTPEQIYSNPRTRQMADFIGDVNYIEGDVSDGVFVCNLGRFDASGRSDGAALLMLRYEDFFFDNASGFPCTVLEKKYKGRTTTYCVSITDTGGEKQFSLNSHDNSLEPGQKTFLRTVASAGCIFDKG